MAHLHNFAKHTGIALGNIGENVKQTAQIAGDIKAIWDVGSFLTNALTTTTEVAEVAMVAAL